MKSHLIYATVIIYIILVLAFSSCSSVVIDEEDHILDDLYLGEVWNEIDSKLVAAQFVNELSASVTITGFSDEHGRGPEISVSKIVNLSDEHIDSDEFTKNILLQLKKTDHLQTIETPQPSPNNIGRLLSEETPNIRFRGDFHIIGSIDLIPEDNDGFKTYRAMAKVINDKQETVLIMIREVRKLILPEDDLPI